MRFGMCMGTWYSPVSNTYIYKMVDLLEATVYVRDGMQRTPWHPAMTNSYIYLNVFIKFNIVNEKNDCILLVNYLIIY